MPPYGECWNPTEAGGRDDGVSDATKSSIQTVATKQGGISSTVKKADGWRRDIGGGGGKGCSKGWRWGGVFGGYRRILEANKASCINVQNLQKSGNYQIYKLRCFEGTMQVELMTPPPLLHPFSQ